MSDRDNALDAPGADDHPNPLLRRREWSSLNGIWDFAFDDDDRGVDERWYDDAPFPLSIEVPFPPESVRSGVNDSGWHPVVWYRRRFGWTPRGDDGERLMLHFNAVDYVADVWLNGQHVAHHQGGHTPFAVDVTPYLADDGRQTVVLRAEDDPHDLEQPRGKQDWEEQPHKIWHRRTTGIWQEVWLEPVPGTYIETLAWEPHVDAENVTLKVRLGRRPGPKLSLRLRVDFEGGTVAEQTLSDVGRSAEIVLGLPYQAFAMSRRTYLWAPEHPNLFRAQVSLVRDDDVIDEVSSYFGMRSVSAADGHVLLNGRPYFLRMVLDQGYWPDTHLAAPCADAFREEVEWIKRLGFNGVRVHQKAEDARFLYWCDRLGVLVWTELPATYHFSARSVDRLTRDWLEIIERYRSHPSLVAWVAFNESWGVPQVARSESQRAAVRSLYALAKAVGGERLVIGNDGWEPVVSDLVAIHDYETSPSTLATRYGNPEALSRTIHGVRPHYHVLTDATEDFTGLPAVLTECGGISFAPDERVTWDAYGTADSADAFLDVYRNLTGAVLASTALAGFCYTQLTDVLHERNGLLDAARKPKADMDEVRRLNRRLASSVPGDRGVAVAYGDFELDGPPVAGAG